MKMTNICINRVKLFLCVIISNCILTLGVNAQIENTIVDSIIVMKEFPFLNLVKMNPEVTRIIRNDTILKKLSLHQIERIKESLECCKEISCYASSVQWNKNEIFLIGNRLIKLYKQSEEFQDLLEDLRMTGYYELYAQSCDTSFLRNTWNHVATSINNVINIYIKGHAPRYPAIDSISFWVNDKEFTKQIHDKIFNLVENDLSKKMFFELGLNFALEALSINGRNEAARYEPLNERLNKDAFQNISTIDWSAYSYSLILVPGSGVKKNGGSPNSLGIHRCNIGAKRYNNNLAPFIVVSGGHVHPYKTPYCEAIEMRNYLVEELNIPEKNIFIEPFARHTTTNIRNTSRMVFRLGLPSEKPIIIVTDPAQSKMILNIASRCIRELGYIPFKDIKKISDEETMLYPARVSLHIDSNDPIDP